MYHNKFSRKAYHIFRLGVVVGVMSETFRKIGFRERFFPKDAFPHVKIEEIEIFEEGLPEFLRIQLHDTPGHTLGISVLKSNFTSLLHDNTEVANVLRFLDLDLHNVRDDAEELLLMQRLLLRVIDLFEKNPNAYDLSPVGTIVDREETLVVTVDYRKTFSLIFNVHDSSKAEYMRLGDAKSILSMKNMSPRLLIQHRDKALPLSLGFHHLITREDSRPSV